MDKLIRELEREAEERPRTWDEKEMPVPGTDELPDGYCEICGDICYGLRCKDHLNSRIR